MAPSTKLHERLKAAREYAGLTQVELGKRLGVTRGAVAQWESSNDEVRSTPDVERVKRFAEACGIPAEMLINDHVTVQMLHTVRPMVRGAPGMAVTAATAARARAFWSAVTLGAIEQNPAMASAFAVPIERHGVKLVAPFLHGRSLAVTAALEPEMTRPELLAREIPGLLMMEKVVGRPCGKHVLVLAPKDRAECDGQVCEEELFGATLVLVTKLDTAIKYLCAL